MKPRNALLGAPPYEVQRAVKKLGADLRTARLRRNLTAGEGAERIGTSRFAVADAERGKPSTSVAVYAALLWVYGLAGRLADAADPRRRRGGHAARGPAHGVLRLHRAARPSASPSRTPTHTGGAGGQIRALISPSEIHPIFNIPAG